MDHHGRGPHRRAAKGHGGRLVSKAHRLVFHSTLGSRVIKKKQKKVTVSPTEARQAKVCYLRKIIQNLPKMCITRSQNRQNGAGKGSICFEGGRVGPSPLSHANQKNGKHVDSKQRNVDKPAQEKNIWFVWKIDPSSQSYLQCSPPGGAAWLASGGPTPGHTSEFAYLHVCPQTNQGLRFRVSVVGCGVWRYRGTSLIKI